MVDYELEGIVSCFDHSPIELANQILDQKPSHEKALRLKLRHLVGYHDFTLHELPWGVLIEGSLEEALASAKEMESIAKKLDIQNDNVNALVKSCKRYYPLWFDYLDSKDQAGFEAFLRENGIDTTKIHLAYAVV